MTHAPRPFGRVGPTAPADTGDGGPTPTAHAANPAHPTCGSPAPTRRQVLHASALAAALLGGCSGLARRAPGQSGLPEGDRLIDLRSGRDVPLGGLLDEVRHSRFTLLGELHDNLLHHQRRGLLIGHLAGSAAVVVAEQLGWGRRADPAGDLLTALQAAGFDDRAWSWPLHEPLFAAVRQAGLPLWGGNLPPAEARRVAREGNSALRPELAELLGRVPLSSTDQARLDADLSAGHCGRLQAERLPAMRLAQRARDAAMALALRDGSGRPALLLAGNGHVRSDYGVPRLLAALDPRAEVVSVLFGEPGSEADAAPATHLWITPAPRRDDPCADDGGQRRPAAPGRAAAV